jgi:cyclopropane fatty-acyl-phospholipid synthase-like methyltransferase
MNLTEQVFSSYNKIAEQWNVLRNHAFDPKYVDLLLEHLDDKAEILDIGCGTGMPIARYLVDQGCSVVGIDASEAMLEIAKQQVPEARFVLGDVLVHELTEQYPGIIAWDSIFHIPRGQHLNVFQKFHQWLLPDGLLLLSLGGSVWEGTSEMFGHEFFYSGFAPDESSRLLEQAGFEILLSEIDDPSSHGHIAVFCKKMGEDAV